MKTAAYSNDGSGWKVIRTVDGRPATESVTLALLGREVPQASLCVTLNDFPIKLGPQMVLSISDNRWSLTTPSRLQPIRSDHLCVFVGNREFHPRGFLEEARFSPTVKEST